MLLIYLIYFILFLGIFLTAFFISRKRISEAKKKLQKPIEEISIYNNLLDLEKKYFNLKNKGYFKGYEELEAYFYDVSRFLDQVDIIDLNTASIHQSEPGETPCASEVSDEFKKKIETAPKAIKNLFVEKNEIMLHIIFFQMGFLEGIKKTHQIKSMKKLSLFLSVLIFAVKITLETLFEHDDNPRPVESRKALLHSINDLEKCTQYISA